MVDVAIIGGGIAGLAAAYELQQRGVSTRVIESSHRPGGVILTERFDGWVVDGGPDSLLVQKPANGEDNVVSLAAVREGRKEKVEREGRRGWRPGWSNFAAIAATLVLGLAIGRSMHDGSPVGVRQYVSTPA